MQLPRARGAARSRRPTLALAALVSVAAAVLSPAFAQEPPAAAPQPTSATHGALAMDAQLTLLDKLGLKTTEPAAPTGIDSVIWAEAVPSDNEPTPERIALGRKLYFDTRLSADGTVACATCHDVSRGFTDQRAVSEGIGGKLGRRNAPTTMNALLFTTQFWDGRAPSLEEQAKLPILNPIEMGQPNGDAVTQKIASDADYQAQFQKAYGRAINYDDLGRAIAAFERTLVFLDSPFDRFMGGDLNAMSADAQKGFALFNGKARCVSCHQLNPANPLGTDNRFHNIGVSARHQDFQTLATKATTALEADPSAKKLDELALETDLSELGRFMVTRRREDIGAFKTTQLRNLGVTAPYMHDGSMQTLWDVMDHYNRGGEANLFLDGGIEPLALGEQEIDQLVAFMFALGDVRFAKEADTAMASQRTRANTQRPFRDEALAMRRVLPFQKAVQADQRDDAELKQEEEPMKSVETKYMEQREGMLRGLHNLNRRDFLKVAGAALGASMAQGVFHPHSFLPVGVANAATSDAEPKGKVEPFRFAYISDSHLYRQDLNDRFVNGLLRAVDDVNAMDPQPDFVFYGGDLAQLGQPELDLGAQILKNLKAPVKMMVGEHDWYLDMGEKWKDLFGADRYSFDHKGAHCVTLNSVVEADFWTERKLTPMQRMKTVAGLDNQGQRSSTVGPEQREWLTQDLAKYSDDTPLIVFSHSPLYKLYKNWNFWTDDADEVQAILKRFQNVVVIHGHTHQLLTNRIGNIHFHGLLSTAWPWPYAPQGLPELTVQMGRPDPFDSNDGCGDGSVRIHADGLADKVYSLWNRNPVTVSRRYLLTNGKEDRPTAPLLASY